MTKNISFFNCYSINLHRFLKASGIRYMNKGVHVDGISINSNGEWKSYSNLRAASEDQNIDLDYLKHIHSELNAVDGKETLVDDDGLEFAKRTRNFWVYLIDDKLDRALEAWRQTGPKKDK